MSRSGPASWHDRASRGNQEHGTIADAADPTGEPAMSRYAAIVASHIPTSSTWNPTARSVGDSPSRRIRSAVRIEAPPSGDVDGLADGRRQPAVDRPRQPGRGAVHRLDAL